MKGGIPVNRISSTVNLVDSRAKFGISTTGSWKESQTLHPEHSEKLSGLMQFTKTGCLALCLALSPVTTITDPWFDEKKRRDAGSSVLIYQQIRRLVSRFEALSMARQILMKAEKERLAIVEFEAAQGIQWLNEA